VITKTRLRRALIVLAIVLIVFSISSALSTFTHSTWSLEREPLHAIWLFVTSLLGMVHDLAIAALCLFAAYMIKPFGEE